MSTFETIQNTGAGSSGMSFDESKFKLRSRAVLGDPEVPTVIRFLVTKNIVKTENQAVVVMLAACVLIIATTVFVFRSSGVDTAVIDPTLIEESGY